MLRLFKIVKIEYRGLVNNIILILKTVYVHVLLI